MTERDLTRWNRAGLSRIRYVDGNAVTYLEELRHSLAASFPEWALVEVAGEATETEADRLTRMLRQYEGAAEERLAEPTGSGTTTGGKDWGWEIARAFARALHVLTGHLDAYANEGFLETATQWENVRRLVAMLDYWPAPPASAGTPLVLTAKTDGPLPAGFAVQHVPPGKPPVVFETLEDLEVASAMDRIRPAGATRDPSPLGGRRLRLLTGGKGLAVGQPVVLQAGGLLSVHLVDAVRQLPDPAAPAVTEVLVTPAIPPGFTAGGTVVHVRPQDRVELLGPGAPQPSPLDRSLQLREEPAGLHGGDVVHVTDGYTSCLRRVKAVRGRRVVLTQALENLDTSVATVGPAARLPVADIADREEGRIRAIRCTGDWRHLVGRTVAKPEAQGGALVEYVVMGADYHAPDEDSADRGMTRLRATRGDEVLADLNPQSLFIGPGAAGPWRTDAVLHRPDGNLPGLLESGIPRKAGPGDLLVLARGGQAAVAVLGGVAVDGDTAGLSVDPASWHTHGGGPWHLGDTAVLTAFKDRVRVVGWDVNRTPLSGTTVALEGPVPDLLVKGRRVVLEAVAGPAAESAGDPVLTTVTRVAHAPSPTVSFSDALPADATVGSLSIRGNVVLAGHGETRPERVLGSGDATRRNQAFVLDAPDISFVDDPTQGSGVRAAVEVRVDGRLWEQVATLRDSGTTDPHYAVRMTEDGHLRITFGDGVHARRLPTGQNNVRVTFRQGSGLRGLLESGLLTKPKRPSPYVAAVAQPLPTSGAGDVEDVASIRRNAPSALLSLDRAVSLSDVTHLAGMNSKLWQAVALPPAVLGDDAPAPGRAEQVAVVVIPAGGGELTPQLRDSVRSFLLNRCVAGVDITVRPAGAVLVKLRLTLRVDVAGHNPDTVVAAVREDVTAALTLPTRRLGQPLHASDVIAVVEAVPGVVSSRHEIVLAAGQCRVVPAHAGPSGPPIRSLHPDPDQVVRLSDATDAVDIGYEEATS